MKVQEAMAVLTRAWLDAPRMPLGTTPSGKDRGSIVTCPACRVPILMTRPGSVDHMQHHRTLAAQQPLRFFQEVAPLTHWLPIPRPAAGLKHVLVGLGEATRPLTCGEMEVQRAREEWRTMAALSPLAVSQGAKEQVRRAVAFVREHVQALRLGGTRLVVGAAPFILMHEDDWHELHALTRFEDFEDVALTLYRHRANVFLRDATACPEGVPTH